MHWIFYVIISAILLWLILTIVIVCKLFFGSLGRKKEDQAPLLSPFLFPLRAFLRACHPAYGLPFSSAFKQMRRALSKITRTLA